MPFPERPAKKLDVTWSLKMTSTERKEASRAGEQFNCGDQEAYRRAARVGFKIFRLLNYDIEGTLAKYALELAKKKTGE